MIYRTIDVNTAAGVLDDDHLKAVPTRILGGVTHAEIKSQARQYDALKFAVSQITGQTGHGFVVIFVEGGIGIDVVPVALPQHKLGVRNL